MIHGPRLKRPEISFPFSTYLNSATTIYVVKRVSWVTTSFSHGTPYSIQAHIPRCKFFATCGSYFSLQTTTRL